MEELFNLIKAFILDDVNEVLPDFEDSSVELPSFADKNIVFGAVDLQKNAQNVVCAILPEEETEDDGYINGANASHQFTVAFLVRNAVYETLVKRMCRYASAFRRALFNNPDFDAQVEDIEIGERRFFYDAGAVEKQCCIVEISLTIFTTEEI